MSILLLLIVAGVFASAAWLLFDRVQRYRGLLAADTRARELVESWNERAEDMKRLQKWTTADPRNRADR